MDAHYNENMNQWMQTKKNKHQSKLNHNMHKNKQNQHQNKHWNKRTKTRRNRRLRKKLKHKMNRMQQMHNVQWFNNTLNTKALQFECLQCIVKCTKNVTNIKEDMDDIYLNDKSISFLSPGFIRNLLKKLFFRFSIH